MPLREALILFGCLVVAIILHELAHGVAAFWLGDDTARRAGRLSLNPVRHVDPFGSLILPAMGALAGLPVVGYAKPVPVDPARLRRPRRDLVLVSLAGPAANFVLMGMAALLTRWLLEQGGVLGASFDQAGSRLVVQVVFSFAVVNLLLGVFNLLPIPPLDGSALVERALPVRWLPAWYRFRPYGLLVVFLLVFTTGIVGRVVTPFYDRLYDFVVQ